MGDVHFIKTFYPICYQETAEMTTAKLIVSCCGMASESTDQSGHKVFIGIQHHSGKASSRSVLYV